MKLESILKIFTYYRGLGKACIDRLSYDQLRFRPDPHSNSMAIMIGHLRGNMLSRWTDFLNSDGEKEWRNRDSEFVEEYKNKEEILAHWNEGWDCLFGALEPLSQDDLTRTVYIRNEGHSVSEAIDRQLAHYSYHIGQMVYLAKLLKGADWESLSIPLNESEAYNAAKFGKDKSEQHFTDEI